MYSKRSTVLIALAVLLSSASFGEARKSLAARNARKVYSPMVLDTAYYYEYTTVDGDTHYWELDMTPPTARIGWETEQTYSTQNNVEYYQIKFKPYVETQFIASSILNIQYLLYNELTVDLSKFMTNVFGEIYIYYDGYLCFNAGWETEDILLTVETALKLYDCYKIVIQSLTDWTNWDGLGKKATNRWYGLLDSCDESDDESVTLYSWNPVTTDTIEYWLGTGTTTGEACVDVWPISNLIKMYMAMYAPKPTQQE